MNEQVKMSDVFAMPISGNGYCGGFFDSAGELILFSDLEVNQAVSIFKAINEYDQHIEIIAKQAEQIKMLHEALKRTLITGVEFINSYDVDDEEDKATIETNFNNSLISAENALSATEQK